MISGRPGYRDPGRVRPPQSAPGDMEEPYSTDWRSEPPHRPDPDERCGRCGYWVYAKGHRIECLEPIVGAPR